MSNLGWITINSLNYINIVYQIESFNTVESFKFGGGGAISIVVKFFSVSVNVIWIYLHPWKEEYIQIASTAWNRDRNCFLSCKGGKFVVGWGVFMASIKTEPRGILILVIPQYNNGNDNTWYIKIQQNINTWHNTYWLNHSKLLEFLMHIFFYQFY